MNPTDREIEEKEQERERGAWHCSSVSDGSFSALRHGLPLISLSLDMKMEEKAERRVAEGTIAETFCSVLCQIDFYFITLLF